MIGCWIAGTIIVSGLFATVRTALVLSRTSRVLGKLPEGRRRAGLARLLERADLLATCASLIKVTMDLALVTLLLAVFEGEGPATWGTVALAIAVALPVRFLLTEALPEAIARSRGDALLRSFLPILQWVLRPLELAVRLLRVVEHGLLALLGLEARPAGERQTVEGLREVVRETEHEGPLDETERELIENVMELGEVDAAAVMTPRTEVHAIGLESGAQGAAAMAQSTGHSRIPVYEGNVDTIVGTVTVRDLLEVAAGSGLASADLREVMKPPYFIPETKRISELLTEFRREKIKLAVVLDEYGGTAGIVTLGDVLAEIVGEFQDDHEQVEESPLRELSPGRFEVDASLHVTEVNENLDLNLPEEEDYETLGGFVLSALGHLPKEGETFVSEGVSYRVSQASDRRVLRVVVDCGPLEAKVHTSESQAS